jgi:predicted dehydrogenase
MEESDLEVNRAQDRELSMRSIQAAIVGLGFGAEFIPIYLRHPHVNLAALCQRNETKLNELGNAFGIDKRYTRYDELLADPSIDFVHVNSPIPDHAWMSIEALRARKHVLCTVPMATNVADCETICQLVADTRLKYMMAETVVYSREFLFIRELYRQASSAAFSICRPRTRRTWMVGPTIGSG